MKVLILKFTRSLVGSIGLVRIAGDLLRLESGQPSSSGLSLLGGDRCRYDGKLFGEDTVGPVRY